MKKMKASVQRILSVMLAAAMVATAVPQTGMYAFAQEADTGTSQVVSVNEEETESSDAEGIVSSGEGEEQEASQNDAGDENTPSDSENTNADTPSDSEGVDADELTGDNGNASGDTDSADSEDGILDNDEDADSEGEEDSSDKDEAVTIATPEDDGAGVMPLEDGDEGDESDEDAENVVTIPVVGEHFTIQDTDDVKFDGENLKITLPKSGNRLTANFTIVPEDESEEDTSYIIKSIRTVKSDGKSGSLSLAFKSESGSRGTIRLTSSRITGECTLTITMSKGTLDDVASIDGKINVETVEKQDYTWTFTYLQEDLDVKVQKINGDDADKDITLSPGDGANTYTASISNETSVMLLVKANEEAKVPFVVWGGDEYPFDEKLEDGSYEFDLGRSYNDTTVEINASEVYNVTFRSDLEDLQIELLNSNGEETYSYINLEDPYPVEKGKAILFALENFLETGDVQVSVNGEILNKLYNEEDGLTYYKYTPEEDTTITIGFVPQQISLEYSDGAVTDLQIEGDGVDLSDDKKAIIYTSGEDAWPTLKFKTADGVRLQNILLTYNWYEDEDSEVYATRSYSRDEINVDEEGYYLLSDINSEVTKITINTLEVHTIPILDVYGVINKLEVVEVTGADEESLLNQDGSAVEIVKTSMATVRLQLKDEAKDARIGAYYVVSEPGDNTDNEGNAIYENHRYVVDDITSEGDGYYSFTLEVSTSTVEIGITSDKTLNTESRIVLEYETAAIKEIRAWTSQGYVTADLVNEIDNGRTEEIYLVATDDSIGFEITTNSSYTIIKETLTQGGYTDETDVSAGTTQYTRYVGAHEGDARLSIDTTDLPNIDVKVYPIIGDGEDSSLGEELTSTKATASKTTYSYTYNAKQAKKYAVRVYTYGTQVEPSMNGKLSNATAEVKEDKTVEVEIQKDVSAGRSISLRMVVDEPVGDDRVKQTKVNVIFSIKGDIEKVQLTGVTYNDDGTGVMEKSVDSRKRLTVKFKDESDKNVSASTIDINALGMEFNRSEGVSENDVSAEFEILKSQTPRISVVIGPDAELGKTLGTIKLCNKDYQPGDEKYYIEGGTVDIVATSPTKLEDTTPKPEVSYVDDISITLNVPSPSPDDVEAPLVGNQYFKVVVTPKGENVTETIKEATAKPFYFKRQIPEDISDEDADEVEYEKVTQKLYVLVDSESRRGTITEKDVCDFDVKVSIVQTNGDEKTEDGFDEARIQVRFNSKEASVPTVTTKASSFETKLTLKKGTTKIYTTQQDVVAATTKFTATTNNRLVTVEDTTDVSDEEKLAVRFEDDQILVSASAKTKLGKHTIAVTPYGPATMYQPTSTLTVTVEKGIEEIVLTSPNYIYKPADKAASLQVKVSYNTTNNTDGVQPKTKKVKWSIVDKYGDAFDPEYDEDIYKYVTVNSSGKVSINKKLDTDDIEYSFYVKATANDYNGSSVTGMSEEITVSADGLEYSTLALVKQEGEEFTVLATDTSTKSTAVSLNTAELKGTMLVALGIEVEKNDTISTISLLNSAIYTDNLTAKSSNKVVTLTSAETGIQVDASKPVNNVKLTVTAADGSKTSKVLKLSVVAATPDKLRLSVEKDGSAIKDVSTADYDKIDFNGTINTKLTLRVMQQTGESDFEPLNAYTNHTVKISGGKLLYSDVAAGEYTAIVTSDKATVTLKNTAKNITETYTITNSSYSAEKAPKVSITSGTSKSIWSGAPDEGDTKAVRTLSYTLGGTNYAWAGKSVIVEVNAVDAASAKRSDAYAAFKEACLDLDKTISVGSGSLTLNFNNGNIPAGSYKLTLTFGTPEAGTIKADAKPVALTVKAAAPKKVKGSYKAAASYKIEAAPGKPVEFSGTGKQIQENAVYYEILASNVKGKPNKFLEYFELERDEQGQPTNRLKLKDKEVLTDEQIKEIEQMKIAKDDLTGYVTYTVSYGDDGYGHPTVETKTVKVTVKLVAPTN